MKKIFIYLIALIALMNAWSCKKSLLDLPSKSSYDYTTFFSTQSALNQAVIGTYSTLLHDGLWAREYYYIFDLMGDDAKKTTNLGSDFVQLSTYNFNSSQSDLAELWNSLYRMAFRANVVIDRVNAWNPDSAALYPTLAKQYIAEARFLRSYAYFNIVNLWGAAPLITSYDSVVNNHYFPRSPTSSIWAFIESDLVSAIPDLPVAYDSATDLGRATKGAATALLGKAYLYEKKWDLAQTTLAQLTQAPFAYKLDPSYDDIFSPTNQNSPENIFHIMNAAWTSWGIGNQYYVFGGQETWGGIATHSDRAQEYGFKDWWNTYVTTRAVNAFHYPNPQDGTPYVDPRAYSTFYGTPASGGDTVYCEQCSTGKISYPFNAADPQGDYSWRKYEYYNLVPSLGGPQSSIGGQVIRYADVLLMLAESYIQQGDVGSNPLGLINQVRQRVGAVPYTTLGADQTSAMNVLMLERDLELCGEQSRYFDLIRWGIAKQTINAERTIEPGDGTQPFQDKNVLFPIPDVEKDYNPIVAAEVQNGWN